MGKIKKIIETDLVGGSLRDDVYPVTSTKAVYDTKNRGLEDLLKWGGVINLTEKYGPAGDSFLTSPFGRLIQKVPLEERVPGFLGSYKDIAQWKLVRYNGISVEDTYWNNTANWSEVITSSGGGSEDLSDGMGSDPNATINQKALSELLAQIPRWHNVIFPEISWFDNSSEKMASYDTLIYVNTLVRRVIREIAYIGDISFVNSINLTDLRIITDEGGESSLASMTIYAKIVVEHGKNLTGTNTFTLSNKTIVPSFSNTKDVIIYTLSGGDDINVQMKIAFSIFDLKTILLDNSRSFDMTTISIQPFVINPFAIANEVNYPNIAGKGPSTGISEADSIKILEEVYSEFVKEGNLFLNSNIKYTYNPLFIDRIIPKVTETPPIHHKLICSQFEYMIKTILMPNVQGSSLPFLTAILTSFQAHVGEVESDFFGCVRFTARIEAYLDGKGTVIYETISPVDIDVRPANLQSNSFITLNVMNGSGTPELPEVIKLRVSKAALALLSNPNYSEHNFSEMSLSMYANPIKLDPYYLWQE